MRGLTALSALGSLGLARNEKLKVRVGRWAGLTEELQTKTRNLESRRRERVSWSQDLRPSGTGGNVIIGKGGLAEETV